MHEAYFIEALARGITKAAISLPFAVGLIWFGVRCGICEWAEMPRPSIKQMFVAASAIVWLS